MTQKSCSLLTIRKEVLGVKHPAYAESDDPELYRIGRSRLPLAVLAAGVDGAVRRIGRTYEIRGMVEKVTSFSDAAGSTVVNEVRNGYNDFTQLALQYQEHAGAVNTGTSPRVTYAYADGGTAKADGWTRRGG